MGGPGSPFNSTLMLAVERKIASHLFATTFITKNVNAKCISASDIDKKHM
jgi:hypothetical protein